MTATSKFILAIEHRAIGDIRPYENNPRINDDAVAAVVASIREFGFRQPIVVDEEGVIIVGHTRYKAAQQLGLEKVPVHVAKGLTPAQVKAYRIADNQTATLAEWNYDLLPIELADLQGLDFDLDLLGFDTDELAKILSPELKDGQCDPDDVPEPPDEATTQKGDLWLLGEHRLLCGDSSSVADLDRLLDGQPIHLCNTDPPYNVKVEPRSNNAIAAGLPRRRSRLQRSCVPRIDRSPTTSSRTSSSTYCWMPGSATSPACCCRDVGSTSGAGTPTARTTRRS
jgi:ParB-like chromosome segregation protein Spo0J